VSRALRGLDRVNADTRARVLLAASALGYVASPAASSLATGRTMTVGVVVPHVTRWYFANVVEGAEALCRAHGYDLLLYGLGEQVDVARRLTAIATLHKRVDAVLVLNLALDGPEVDVLRTLSVPVALVGSTVTGLGSVSVDDVQVARTATEHLISLGHTRIAHMGGLAEDAFHFPTPHDRFAGYLGALADAGLPADPALDVYGGWSVQGGSAAMDVLLALPDGRRPTAVFASSDEMAMGALSSARRHGVRVPADLSVVGVDDHEMAEYLDLTTVRQPVPEQGRMAAQLLLDELEGRTPRGGSPARTVATELVVRGTTGPAPTPVDPGPARPPRRSAS
jgi:LacI family repressor for deo operon, udp, cdd, tsx, nupC, and nupG